MIPITLTLSGFLSYLDPVEVDFTAIELACISGYNGAGKSSLLDAITWALFGQARRTGEAVVHSAANAAEVTLVFQYEGNTYRVQRSLPRGKTSVLEFHIRQPNAEQDTWKPLTEATLRTTQARIEQTLRLDYETFVNASFFLQGKADQFTQQRPADRKRILASILGLDAWESYRERAANRRKSIEADVAALDGRLAEIAAELKEEDARKALLKTLESELERLSQSRAAQEANLESIRQLAAALGEQRRLVEALARQVEAASRRTQEIEIRIAARQKERDAYSQLAERAPAIRQAHADWQAARSALEQWDAIAVQFRQHEGRRQPYLDEINAARARLQQELQSLEQQQAVARDQQAALPALQEQIAGLEAQIAAAEARLAERSTVEAELHTGRTRLAEARAENPRLKAEMDELKTRIDQLSSTAGAVCPLCGQPLSEADRQRHVIELQGRGKELGDRYRANQTMLKEADQLLREYETRLKALMTAEQERLALAQSLATAASRLENLQSQVTAWETNAAPRLLEVRAALERDDFASEARTRLAEVDTELKATGYDAAAHDAARLAEFGGRATEADLRALERAQAALDPLDREIAELNTNHRTFRSELDHLQADHAIASAAFANAQAATPDLYSAERQLLVVQEQENRLRLEVGAARQKVLVLDDLKGRRQVFETQREDLARTVGRYKQLERSFGKDGVPALLIEQALPQIEGRANDILERLSGGGMTVRFVTQSAYKDKRRDDLRETLEILISDGAGTRDYEMFSGGEAFRANFAIRLALSEVLAQRAGARLQTLVIDEGFGSQDALGRQRLIEAINLVKKDFAKILVITHIDELKDAFPTRIEVEKTERGSSVRMM